MAVVTANHLPAPRPRPAMAGVMRAKMRTGTKNPRKLPNRPLKVAKTRASHTGKKKLHAMPRMMATMILKSSDEVIRLKSMMDSSLCWVFWSGYNLIGAPHILLFFVSHIALLVLVCSMFTARLRCVAGALVACWWRGCGTVQWCPWSFLDVFLPLLLWCWCWLACWRGLVICRVISMWVLRCRRCGSPGRCGMRCTSLLAHCGWRPGWRWLWPRCRRLVV